MQTLRPLLVGYIFDDNPLVYTSSSINNNMGWTSAGSCALRSLGTPTVLSRQRDAVAKKLAPGPILVQIYTNPDFKTRIENYFNVINQPHSQFFSKSYSYFLKKNWAMRLKNYKKDFYWSDFNKCSSQSPRKVYPGAHSGFVAGGPKLLIRPWCNIVNSQDCYCT